MPRRAVKARALPRVYRRKARAPVRKARRPLRRAVVMYQPQLIKPITLNPGRDRPAYRSFTLRNQYNGSAGQVDHLTTPNVTTIPTFATQITQMQLARLSYMPTAEYDGIKALYTHYKILSVTCTFTLNCEAFTGVISGAQFIPRLLCRYQYDADTGSSPSDATFAQMRNVKVYNFSGEAPSARYKFYPRCLDTIYQSVVTVVGPTNSSNAPMKPRWFDIDYPHMNHYGIWWMMPYLPVGGTLNVEYTVNYAVKQQT